MKKRMTTKEIELMLHNIEDDETLKNLEKIKNF